MSLLDRKYIVTANLDDGSVEAPNIMKFYNTDTGIANIYLKLIKKNSEGIDEELTTSDLIGYKITLKALKPKTMQLRTLDGVMNADVEINAPIKFELDSEFTNQDGNVRNQLFISIGDKKLTIDEFKFNIRLSMTTDINDEISSNPDKSILEELIDTVKETAQTVNNIDNVNVSDTKTYSNSKIEEKFDGVNAQFESSA